MSDTPTSLIKQLLETIQKLPAFSEKQREIKEAAIKTAKKHLRMEPEPHER